jgi:CheY-like chemotaxis protein
MKRILVVEDDTSIRELLVELLESEGYEVNSSENGSEGIKALESMRPDLILMDMMMPIMDGYGFRQAQLERSEWRDIPLVAMSAQEQDDLENFGIMNFLPKPLEINHLLETVRSLS